MLYIDFTKQKEPFTFIKELMTEYSDDEVLEAHQNYRLFLNQLLRIFNEQELEE